MPFTEVFGGQVTQPSQLSFLSLTFDEDVQLQWPLEQAVAGIPVVADIMELHPEDTALAIAMPDARQTANGNAVLFYNAEAETVTITDVSGNTLLTVASGEAWYLYLRSNATLNGTWQTFEFGAGTSSATAASLAGAGLKAITTTLNQTIPVQPVNTPTTIVNADRAQAKNWTGGSAAMTLPNPATVGNDWFFLVRNSGSGTLTLTASAGTIDGGATKIMNPGTSAIVVSDGTNMITVGFGQAINSVFDFISIDVAGTGDYVLAGPELNRIAYRFTGVLTGNRVIIVPAVVQQYWVDNQTSGAFTLTVKTALGSGIAVTQGQRSILYCDGTNVLNAETVLIFTPVPVEDGGTGITVYAQGDLIYATAPTTLARLAKSAVATRYLANTGSSNNPAWDLVNLANGVTGNLPIGNLDSGINAAAGTVWRGDGQWAVPTIATNSTQLGGVNAVNYARLDQANSFGSPNIFLQRTSSPFIALTDGVTITPISSDGNNWRVTLGGNRTLAAATSPVDGQRVFLFVTQDGTGGRTLAFNAVYVFENGATPTLQSTPGATDIFEMVYNSTLAQWRVFQWPNSAPSGSTSIVINGGSVGLDLFRLAGSPGGVVTINVEIQTGVVIYAPNPSTPALNLAGFASGSTLNLVNRGYILGAGGEGGDGSMTWDQGSGLGNATYIGGYDGRAGGNAINGPGAGITLNIDNGSGFIWGGGGGGGGGGSSADSGTGGLGNGGGGGGGAGGGIGGRGGRAAPTFGQFGVDGSSASTGPSGGLGGGGAGDSEGSGEGVSGGGGGDWGTAGTAGTASSAFDIVAAPGTGGAAGKAVELNGGLANFTSGSGSPNVEGAVS